MFGYRTIGFGGKASRGEEFTPGDLNSYKFLGTADSLLLPSSEDWNFGEGDWTIDFRYYTTATATNEALFRWHSVNMEIRRMSSGNWYLSHQQGGNPIGTWSPSILTWYHIACVMSSNTWTVYVDGVALSMSDNTSVPSIGNTESVHIGQRTNQAFDFIGNLDEFRVSKGVARWTTNFDPPTAEYTADGSTELLIHSGEAIATGTTGSAATFVESGDNGHTVTEVSNAIRDTTVYYF